MVALKGMVEQTCFRLALVCFGFALIWFGFALGWVGFALGWPWSGLGWLVFLLFSLLWCFCF